MYVTDGALMSHPIFHFVLNMQVFHACVIALQQCRVGCFFVHSLKHKGIIQCEIFNGGLC